MKKTLYLLPLFLFACKSKKEEPASSQRSVPMSLLAIGPVVPDSIKITPGGDTLKYFHETKTGTTTYSYDVPVVVVIPKGTVTPPANKPPVANAGADFTITFTGTSGAFKLDASGSSDPEGQTLKYYWRQTAGTKVTITDTNKVIASVSNAPEGVFEFEVRAVDPLNAFTADRVTVTVKKEAGGTPVPFSFSQLPIGDPDLNRGGAGAEQWHDRNDVNLGYTPVDVYYRFVSTRIATATRGVYNWSYLDGLINNAITRKQKLSFGIMTSYPEGTTNEGLINISGGTAAYPAWLQSAMSGEWLINGSWVANYNDPVYLAWVLELNQAIYSHLQTTTFNGVKYKDVINSIDIRSYGSWGEWHSANLAENFTVDRYPAGTFPTAASLKKIIDAYIIGFPDIQLSCMIAGFDAHWLNNTWNAPEVAHYLLTQRNQKGLIGWRRDQWGATDSYLSSYLENNNRSYNGVVFKDLIMERWKYAPITGEPPAWIPNDYADLERQIKLYHATSFGNGNYGTNNPNSTIQGRVKASSKAAGYRIVPVGGTVTVGTSTITITNNWKNLGLSPTYDNWNIHYEVVSSSGTVINLGVSGFQLRLFLPSTTVKEQTDTFPLILQPGTYTLRMVVKDPTGFRAPMMLQIPGRNSDGSYNIRTFQR